MQFLSSFSGRFFFHDVWLHVVDVENSSCASLVLTRLSTLNLADFLRNPLIAKPQLLLWVVLVNDFVRLLFCCTRISLFLVSTNLYVFSTFSQFFSCASSIYLSIISISLLSVHSNFLSKRKMSIFWLVCYAWSFLWNHHKRCFHDIMVKAALPIFQYFWGRCLQLGLNKFYQWENLW